MSTTSYNFKNHITFDNNKYIKWLDDSGTIRHNVLGVNSNMHVQLNSVSTGNVYINTNTNSKTILNTNNDEPTIIGSKLGIGLTENETIGHTITFSDNASIGLSTSNGSLSIYGTSVTSGASKIELFGSEYSVEELKSSIKIQSGNSTNINAGIGFYTENDSRKMKIYKDGTIEISPNGNDIRCKITNEKTEFDNNIHIKSMVDSTNSSTGSLVVNGGVSVNKQVCIYNTAQALGFGSGGSLTVLGGVSMAKDVYVGGIITSRSDIRLKENIKPIKDDFKFIDFISEVKTLKFNYKDDPDTNHIGFIAQDFIEFPEILRKNREDGYYNLDYSKISVLLVECIKELKDEILLLKQKLKDN